MINFSQNGEYQFKDAAACFTLIALGDVIPAGRLEDLLSNAKAQDVVKDIRNTLKKADHVLFNLEAPLCKQGTPREKCGANFKIDPVAADGLKEMNFSVAALANNHIMDYGEEGLERTLETLDRVGILRHGAGMSQEEARKPLLLDTKCGKISFLNFAEGEFAKIGQDGGGAARIESLCNKEDIVEAKKNSDFLVVSVHAGKEFQHFPSPWIQGLYRGFIDHGVDLVIGHHPHIPQGLERYKDRLIAYSLGDFMFEYGQDPGTCITFALEVGFSKEGIASVQIHPIKKRHDLKLSPLSGKDKHTFIDHINEISNPLTDGTALQRLYEQGLIRHFDYFYMHNLKLKMEQMHKSEAQTKESATFLYNMFDCPSHREALKTVFRLMYQGDYKKDKKTQDYLTGLYKCLETLGEHESLEPWKPQKTIYTKIMTRLKKARIPKLLF